jgi:hypothetical protein
VAIRVACRRRGTYGKQCRPIKLRKEYRKSGAMLNNHGPASRMAPGFQQQRLLKVGYSTAYFVNKLIDGNTYIHLHYCL